MQYLVFTAGFCYGPFETEDEAKNFVTEGCKRVMPITTPVLMSGGLDTFRTVILSKERHDELVRKGIISTPTM